MDFEREIMNNVHEGIRKVITEKMGGYGSPLENMIKEIMENNRVFIMGKMDSAMKSVIENPDFESLLKQEFNRKVAKCLLSGLEGSVEKAVNTFKQDPAIRARMILAIQAIIDGDIK